jgi:S-methylmethionine-dependent homocysteine/selenocysteine methylase
MTIDQYLEFVATWRQSGASIIGGCCGIGPEFIAALSA